MTGWWLRIPFLALAVAGIVVLLQNSSPGSAHQQFWRLTDPWEMHNHLEAARAILFGPSLHQWYVSGNTTGYAPPFELLAVPLALLPDPVAAIAGRCLVAAALGISLWLWQDGDRGVRIALWPVLISLPALHALISDHLFSAIGLLALSLALWAQRRDRWYLVGAAAAIAMIRFTNALPVIAMLGVGAWASPRRSLRALGAGIVVLAPLAGITTWLDPSWPADYIHSLSFYPLAGWPRLAAAAGGGVGVAVLQVAVAAICVALVRKQAGRPLDPDRSALGLALTVVSAPGEGPYTGIFTLPALARVGGRRGLEALPWFASAAAWAALVVAGLLYAGPDWQSAWALFTLVSTWFLLHGYPLLRPDRLIAASRSPGLTGLAR
jgi:hypothetical protein